MKQASSKKERPARPSSMSAGQCSGSQEAPLPDGNKALEYAYGNAEVDPPAKVESKAILPIYVKEIRRSHYMARCGAALAVLGAAQCGAFLIRAKNTFLKEGFSKWLETNCTFISRSTAYNYISLTEHIVSKIHARLKTSGPSLQLVGHAGCIADVQPVGHTGGTGFQPVGNSSPGTICNTVANSGATEDVQPVAHTGGSEDVQPVAQSHLTASESTLQTLESPALESQIIDWIIAFVPPDPRNPQDTQQDKLLTEFHEVTEGKALRNLYEQYGIVKPRKKRRAKGDELDEIMPDPRHPNCVENRRFFAAKWFADFQNLMSALGDDARHLTEEHRTESVKIMVEGIKTLTGCDVVMK